MRERSARVRASASVALLVAAVVFDAVLDDLGPSVIAVLAALLIAPWRSWPRRRRLARADLAAVTAFIAALMLTLLMPDGPLRWLVIGTLTVAYVSSWWLLDSDE